MYHIKVMLMLKKYPVLITIRGHAIAYLFGALYHKPEGRRFQSRMRWIILIYLILPTESAFNRIGTRNLPWGKKRPARRADNLAAICEPNV
jgi:hypothetical protein